MSLEELVTEVRTLVEELRRDRLPKIGDRGISFEEIPEGETGVCYFNGEAYDVKSGTDVRKWREVVIVQTSPKALVTETGYTTPTKPTVTGGFQKWHDLWEGYVAAESVVQVDSYEVPEKWRLNLGGGLISCDVSVLQDVVLSHTPGVLGHFRYDVWRQIMLSDLTSTIIEELETLTYYVYNNDDEEHFFSLALMGVLEKL